MEQDMFDNEQAFECLPQSAINNTEFFSASEFTGDFTKSSELLATYATFWFCYASILCW